LKVLKKKQAKRTLEMVKEEKEKTEQENLRIRE